MDPVADTDTDGDGQPDDLSDRQRASLGTRMMTGTGSQTWSTPSSLDVNESVDTDNDGVGNNADNDDDNDGVEDATTRS